MKDAQPNVGLFVRVKEITMLDPGFDNVYTHDITMDEFYQQMAAEDVALIKVFVNYTTYYLKLILIHLERCPQV